MRQASDCLTLRNWCFPVSPDVNTSDLRFRSGELDGLSRLAPDSVMDYRDRQGESDFHLYDTGPEPSPAFLFFNLNTDKGGDAPAAGPVKGAWFRHAAFRRAVSHAIDRDALITSVLFGRGAKNWSFSTPVDKRWSLPDVPHADYDPAEAKRLLASVGMIDRDGDGTVEDAAGHPVRFSLQLQSNPLRVAMANFIRDDLAKVGLQVTLAPLELNTLTAHIDSDFQYDAVLVSRGTRRPDPALAAGFWRSDGTAPWHPRQRRPDSPEQARVDALMDQIVASPDVTSRQRWWRELHTIANEQAWAIWLPVENVTVAVRSHFGNVRPSGLGAGSTAIVWNAEEIFVKPQARETN